jgi:hypothetical protein
MISFPQPTLLCVAATQGEAEGRLGYAASGNSDGRLDLRFTSLDSARDDNIDD